jgi:hypothetical protein
VLTGILFPFGWLAHFSTAYAAAFDRAFATQASHVVMHTALFAGLALCVLESLSKRPRRQAVILALAVIACAAVGQEALQVISVGILRVGDTLFDLCVDMTSGGSAAMLACYLTARHQVKPIG